MHAFAVYRTSVTFSLKNARHSFLGYLKSAGKSICTQISLARLSTHHLPHKPCKCCPHPVPKLPVPHPGHKHLKSSSSFRHTWWKRNLDFLDICRLNHSWQYSHARLNLLSNELSRKSHKPSLLPAFFIMISSYFWCTVRPVMLLVSSLIFFGTAVQLAAFLALY